MASDSRARTVGAREALVCLGLEVLSPSTTADGRVALAHHFAPHRADTAHVQHLTFHHFAARIHVMTQRRHVKGAQHRSILQVHGACERDWHAIDPAAQVIHLVQDVIAAAVSRPALLHDEAALVTPAWKHVLNGQPFGITAGEEEAEQLGLSHDHRFPAASPWIFAWTSRRQI